MVPNSLVSCFSSGTGAVASVATVVKIVRSGRASANT